MTLKLKRFNGFSGSYPYNYPKLVLFPLRTAIFRFNLVRGAFVQVTYASMSYW